MGGTETVFGPNIICFSSRLFVYNDACDFAAAATEGDFGGAIEKADYY